MRIKILFLFLLCFSNYSFSQPDTSLNLKNYFTSYLKDTRDVTLSPIKWNKKQWVTAGVILSSAAILSTQDVVIHDFFKRNSNTTTHNITKYGLEPGGGNYPFAILSALFVYGTLTKDMKSRQVALLGAKTFLVTGLFAQISKQLIHRQRPYQAEKEAGNLNQYNINGPFNKYFDYTSLPSGHTISAFGIATIISSAYKERRIVPILSYSLATLTGISRIHDNDHWASDVIIGGALGWSIAKLIYSKNHWGIKLEPYGNSRELGINLKLPLK